MAPVAADMHRLEARIASFAAVTRPKRLAKLAFPLSPDTHPRLTPASLASAGFYHTPVSEEEDACTCFLCPLALSGWDEDDNPHVEHVGRDTPCAWKELVCALEVDQLEGGPGRLRKEYASAEELPSSEARTALRVQTFGHWWPHATPSAEDLARAGFICTPSKGSPDGTTCPLCKYEVVEWEEDDDPLAIHKRKQPDCPFFTATVKKGRRTTKAAAPSKRATRGQAADDSVQEIPPPEAPEAPAAPKRRGRPPKSSTASSANTSTSTASKPRAKRKTAAEKRAEAEAAAAAEDSLELPAVPADDSVVLLDAPEPEPAPAPTTRSRSSSRAPEERATKPLPRKGRARKTTQNDKETEVEVPSRAARSAPAPAPEKEALAPSNAGNVLPRPEAPAPLALSKALPSLPDSPSVAHTVSDMVKGTGGSPGPTALGAQERAMTLEDYVRKQFQARHDELREQGEAVIVAWEGRAREGRERVERAFA